MPNTLNVYLNHSPQAFELYYGTRALAQLEAIAAVARHGGPDDPSVDEMAQGAGNADVLIAYRQPPITAELLDRLPRLKAVCRVAVDVRNIDIEAASRHGILVTHATPGFGPSVSEWVIGVMIDLSRQLSSYNAIYHSGGLPEATMGGELRGSRLGIVGYGTIGRYLTSLAHAFGMRVLVCDPYAAIADTRVEQTDMDSVLQQADFVVCLAPANAETHHLFGPRQFSRMKPSAFFINPSRGELVDESALLDALNRQDIAGAALDVGSAADQKPAQPLTGHPRVIATPHIGGLTHPATEHQALDTVRQVEQILRGDMPDGALNPEKAHRFLAHQKTR